MPSNDSSFSLAAELRRRGLLVGAAMACTGVAAKTASGAASPVLDATTRAELDRAARRGTICSPSNVSGSGLRGEYFGERAAVGAPLLVRVDPTIDFDRSLDWPADQGAHRPRSALWLGWIKPPLSGRYLFHADQPGARLMLAQQALLGPDATGRPGIELAAGRYYPVSLEVDHLETMTGRLKLEWTAPYGARYVIPRALLYVPSEQVAAPTKP